MDRLKKLKSSNSTVSVVSICLGLSLGVLFFGACSSPSQAPLANHLGPLVDSQTKRA